MIDMKKISKIIIITTVFIIAIILLWRVPIYYKLKSIEIPMGSTEIETKVCLSDVYELHIIGERVIKYDGGYESVCQYIQENNTDKKIKNIDISPFFKDWDDFAVFPSDYNKVRPDDYNKYVVIKYYKSLQ